MERLTVYACWTWDKNGPQYRKAQAPKKKALLVSSCAAPRIIGRWLFWIEKQLKLTAKTVGVEVVGTLFTGMVARGKAPEAAERCSGQGRCLGGENGLSGNIEDFYRLPWFPLEIGH
jgi:hypothetical protein